MAAEDRRREWFEMGRVLRRTWGSYRAMPQLSLAIAGLFVALPEALAALLISQQDAATANFTGQGLNIALGLVSLVGQTALIHAALRRQQGKSVAIGSSISEGGRLFLAMWGLSILTGLGIVLGLVLLIGPGLFLMTIWAVAAPARIMNGPGVSEAMSASSELTRGVRWQVFALVLLALIVLVVVAGGIAVGVEYLPSVLNLVGTVIVSPVVSALATLIIAYGSAALYHELKWGPAQGPADTTADIFD